MDPKRSPRTGMAGSSPGGGGAAGPAAPAGSAAARIAAAAGKAAPAKGGAPAVSEALDRLAAEIRQLRVDFERFFSGALPFPPEELRRRVQGELRQLRTINAMTAVERFRLGDLEARHNSYDELFSRRLRDREEGRGRAEGRAGQAPLSTPPAPQAPQRYDPAAGIAIGRSPDPRAVAALYDGLTTVGGAEGPRFDLASFGGYLQRQAAAIRDKTGCDEVQFRLVAEDGKLKLKARPRPVAAANDRQEGLRK